jgi:hypothetical protein
MHVIIAPHCYQPNILSCSNAKEAKLELKNAAAVDVFSAAARY